MTRAPETRVRIVNACPVHPDRRHVLYWMTAHRRLQSNFALQHAAALAIEYGRPLVIYEPLRVDHRWASDRLHQFVIEGMANHAHALTGLAAQYLPHVEEQPGDTRGLFTALCRQAVTVVTDDFPAFFLPAMIERAGQRIDVQLVAVDSNGLLPMRSPGRPFATALAFRAYVQRTLRGQLTSWPSDIDWRRLPRPPHSWRPPAGVSAPTELDDLGRPERLLARLPIDHSVPPVTLRGGARAGLATLQQFISARLTRYARDGNHPDLDATSGLSPYLHFGHLSSHEVFSAVMTAEGWTSRRLAPGSGGKRAGWWGVSASAEAFLDQLITWRELGFHACVSDPDGYADIRALPDWARRTLDAHAADRRPWLYSLEQLESASTHDEVWNAAQRQLVRDGWMHNYLRMLWGKKILEWSASADSALETMIALMDRYAIDGRDPNSYSGYLWTLGRYDRPWGPERAIFGTVRYMSSENTKRKLKIKRYLQRYSA